VAWERVSFASHFQVGRQEHLGKKEAEILGTHPLLGSPPRCYKNGIIKGQKLKVLTAAAQK
jgi:hypothetical protein